MRKETVLVKLRPFTENKTIEIKTAAQAIVVVVPTGEEIEVDWSNHHNEGLILGVLGDEGDWITHRIWCSKKGKTT